MVPTGEAQALGGFIAVTAVLPYMGAGKAFFFSFFFFHHLDLSLVFFVLFLVCRFVLTFFFVFVFSQFSL